MTATAASATITRRESGTPDSALDWITGTGAFAVEIALGITWGIVGHRIGTRIAGPIGGWVGAAVAVAALVLVWATWMAPNSGHRLGMVGRIVLSSSLILAASAAAWLTGSTTWALILAIGGIAITAGAELLSS